jgi:hypothetical protein
MWWYISFGIVFSIYALDLLFLFIASIFAAIVEHFAPPLSTAACRAAKRNARGTSAQQQQKQQQAAAMQKAKALEGNKNPDLDIVVDTRATIQVSDTRVTRRRRPEQQGVRAQNNRAGWSCRARHSLCAPASL